MHGETVIFFFAISRIKRSVRTLRKRYNLLLNLKVHVN